MGKKEKKAKKKIAENLRNSKKELKKNSKINLKKMMKDCVDGVTISTLAGLISDENVDITPNKHPLLGISMGGLYNNAVKIYHKEPSTVLFSVHKKDVEKIFYELRASQSKWFDILGLKEEDIDVINDKWIKMNNKFPKEPCVLSINDIPVLFDIDTGKLLSHYGIPSKINIIVVSHPEYKAKDGEESIDQISKEIENAFEACIKQKKSFVVTDTFNTKMTKKNHDMVEDKLIKYITSERAQSNFDSIMFVVNDDNLFISLSAKIMK